MKRQRISELAQLSIPQENIVICAWVRTKRDSKNFMFLNMNDGTSLQGVQVVIDDQLENYNELQKLTTGASVMISGNLVASQGGQQAFEIIAKSVKIFGLADPETYPIQKKKMTLEYLREFAHLRPRTNTYSAVSRLRNCLAFAVHQFFQERQFKYIHTPIITAADCEGAGELFRVTTLDLMRLPKKDNQIDYSEDFFGKETFLTVSGQLAVENYCSAMGDVYTFGPTFRAENSNTTRHLAEFWMIEPEIAFADLEDDMALAQDFIQYTIKIALEKQAEDLEFLAKMYEPSLINKLQSLVSSNFEHLTYTKAIELLQKANKSFQFKVEWGMDLQTEHERYLCEDLFNKPTIVTDYPKQIKAFYMKQNEDGKTVRAMDVLCTGIGEIIGGSQREENYDLLESRMRELKMNLNDYQWYLDLRRYGTHPHAGFGLGFERLVQYVTGMANIRDVIPFPRTPKQADF